ncbi:MAG: helix-turn-helix domain-containing protein [Mycobacterium sp.]
MQRSDALTVADVAAALAVSVVTGSASTDVVVTGSTDADAGPWTATELVHLRWESVRADGPFPDLTLLLSDVLQTRPAAVLITPSRPVNPPPAAIELAERANVAILWDRDAAADVTTGVPRLLAPQPSGGTELSTFPAQVLAVADDLRGVLDVLGTTLGARVTLRMGQSAGSTAAPVHTVAVGVRAVLEVDRPTPLREQERRLVHSALPVLLMHTRMSEPDADDRAVEKARSLKLILGDDLAEREQAVRRSRRLSLFSDKPVVFLAVEPFNVPMDMGGLAQLRDDIAPVATRFDPHSVTLAKGGLAVILIDASVDQESFQRALSRAVKAPVAVGAGVEVNEARGYPGSFRQAARAVAVGRSIGAINRLTRYRDLGVLALLYQLPEHTRRSFVAETLGSIAGTGSESLEQRRVLRILRATDCNIAESARRLFVHPNTLRTKISRIEAVTGPLLSDPERRLTVFIALAVFSLDSQTDN